MFKKVVLSCGIVALGFSNVQGAYEYDDPSLGNIAIEGMLWQPKLTGTISHSTGTEESITDFERDLGYDEKKNVTAVSIDIKNDISWLPNLSLDHFSFNESSTGTFTASKHIGETQVNEFTNGQIFSTTDYSETALKAYGYLQNGIMQFDLGVQLKNIDYEQKIEHATTGKDITLKGPDTVIASPYVALKFDLRAINTVLKAESSIVSIGDDEALNYSYSINYRIMKHMYLGVGYKYHGFKSKNEVYNQEKYDVELKGSYFSGKILF